MIKKSEYSIWKTFNNKKKKIVGLTILGLALGALSLTINFQSSSQKIVRKISANNSLLTSKSQGLKLTNYKPLAVEACAPGDYEYEDYFGDGIWETYDECMENEGGDSSNSKEQEEDIYERVRKLEEEQKSQRITLDKHSKRLKELEESVKKILDGLDQEIVKIEEEQMMITDQIREVTSRRKRIEEKIRIVEELQNSFNRQKKGQ